MVLNGDKIKKSKILFLKLTYIYLSVKIYKMKGVIKLTFEDNQIDYKLEIKTLRKFMGKADSLEKYDNLIESATMLVLNCNEEWLSYARVTLNEIKRRKEMALVNGLIKF